MPAVCLTTAGALEGGALIAPRVFVGREQIAERDEDFATSLTFEDGIPRLRRILGHGPSSDMPSRWSARWRTVVAVASLKRRLRRNERARSRHFEPGRARGGH